MQLYFQPQMKQLGICYVFSCSLSNGTYKCGGQSHLSQDETADSTIQRDQWVPFSVVAQLLDEDPTLDVESQSEEVHTLFMSSFEEGLIAVGLLSVAVLTQPEQSWELAQKWLTLIDDVTTVDALGKIVIGPCAPLL